MTLPFLSSISFSCSMALCALTAMGGLCVANSDIDKHIASSLASQKLEATPACDDATFHRRASLVLTGRLPSWQEAEAFLADKAEDKRDKLIDRLMSSDAFVDFQVLKWGDLLRIKAEFPSNIWPNGVQAYTRWVREQVRANRPYDEMIYELLTSTGSNYRDPAVNFYRAFQKREPALIADNVALLFLGIRKAPESFPPFFTQLRYKATKEWKEEIVYLDLDAPMKESSFEMPDGQTIKLEDRRDARRYLARWLVGERGKRVNHAFARCMVNRVWFWIMGRGIIHPVDDLNPKNLPSNKALLDMLEKDFVASGYDIQKLMKSILLSDAFERSSLYGGEQKEQAEAIKHFAVFPTTRLTSEQLIDALGDMTGILDVYTSKVPEPYSYYPNDIRAVQLEDGSVGTPQLELFGRPSRDVSLESDRSNDLNSKQVLYLLNSAGVLVKLAESEKLKALCDESADAPELLKRIYLMMLSRYPSEQESELLLPHLENKATRHKQAQLIIWALLNSPEFLFNH